MLRIISKMAYGLIDVQKSMYIPQGGSLIRRPPSTNNLTLTLNSRILKAITPLFFVIEHS